MIIRDTPSSYYDSLTRAKAEEKTVCHLLSYSEYEQLSKYLKIALSQLCYIPNQTLYAFSKSHGGVLSDRRFPSGECGRFHRISEFDAFLFLVHSYVREETKERIAAVHTAPYRSVFTQADLDPSNILVDRGRPSGIVD